MLQFIYDNLSEPCFIIKLILDSLKPNRHILYLAINVLYKLDFESYRVIMSEIT